MLAREREEENPEAPGTTVSAMVAKAETENTKADVGDCDSDSSSSSVESEEADEVLWKASGGCLVCVIIFIPVQALTYVFSGPGKRRRFDSKHAIFWNTPLRLLQIQAQVIERLCTSRTTTMPVAVLEQCASATPATRISGPRRLIQLGGHPSTKLGRVSA